MSLGFIITTTSFLIFEISSIVYHYLITSIHSRERKNNDIIIPALLFGVYNLLQIASSINDIESVKNISENSMALPCIGLGFFFSKRIKVPQNNGLIKRILLLGIIVFLIIATIFKQSLLGNINSLVYVPFEVVFVASTIALYSVLSGRSIYKFSSAFAILLVTLSVISVLYYLREYSSFQIVLTNIFFIAILTTYQIDIIKSVKSALEKNDFTNSILMYALSQREIEIANEVLQGLSFKEIAFKHNIAYNSVTKHMSNVYSKVGIHGDITTKKQRFIEKFS